MCDSRGHLNASPTPLQIPPGGGILRACPGPDEHGIHVMSIHQHALTAVEFGSHVLVLLFHAALIFVESEPTTADSIFPSGARNFNYL